MIVIPRYIRLALFPVGLNVDHDVPVVNELSLAVAAGAIFLMVLLCAAVWVLRSKPLLGFGGLWFFLALSVESSVIPVYDTMMEHRMYLAMPGLVIAFAALLTQLLTTNRTAALSLAGTLVVGLATLTFHRNQVWQTPLSLWSDAASKSPNKARVHINVGVAHHGLGQFDEAITAYCRAIRADPQVPVARSNIEVALEQQGRLAEIVRGLELKPVAHANAPDGAIILDYDVSEAVCDTK